MRKSTILCVDDEENVVKALLRSLRDDTYDVLSALNGAEGLEIIRANSVHLVISDYRMPGMNGVEFLKEVEKMSPDTLRIMLTGCSDVGVAVAAINEGHVYKFFVKPWKDEELRIEVRRALEHYELVRRQKALNSELREKNKMLRDMNKNLEDMVSERTQQLISSERMATLGQIAAQIGHEINNVLTVLRGKMELLEGKKLDQKYTRKFVRDYLRQLDRLTITSRNLLTLGKPAPRTFENLNIRKVMDTTIENLITAGVIKHYRISRNYQDKLPLIYGDAILIEQVLTNLFVNAHHAMGGEGSLEIFIRRPDGSGCAEVVIRDTGAGIPEEDIARIFEPFFTTKPPGKGTGLGLPVVKKIMDDHGGSIRVESRIHAGTAVTLGFPAAGAKKNQSENSIFGEPDNEKTQTVIC